MSDIDGDAAKTQEWEQLYELLLGILGEYGRDYSSGGDFDYFVIDDEYGDRHHKIEVVNPAFWSDAIQQRVRGTLAAGRSSSTSPRMLREAVGSCCTPIA